MLEAHPAVRLAAFLACLCAVAPARAWTSKEAPFSRAIHQIAIGNVLGKVVAPTDLATLKDEQNIVDKDQQPAQSDEHAMTGVERGQDENTERPIYRAKTEKLLRDRLADAIQSRKDGKAEAAHHHLGKALHALTDGTSPAHEGFQAWRYDESIWSEFLHIMQENRYPEGDLRLRLEGAVRWAYDLFLEKLPLPAAFFRSDGKLDIPPAYLKP